MTNAFNKDRLYAEIEDLKEDLDQKDEKIDGLQQEVYNLQIELTGTVAQRDKRIAELENAQPKWISVEDESPVKCGFYWTTYIKHDKTFSEPVLGIYVDAFKKIESLGNQYFSFTHFMPLFTPQPPKGGDE